MNPSTAQFYAITPFVGYFGFGAFMYLLFGVALLLVWRRDREPGLQWIGVSALLSALFNIGQAKGWVTNPTEYLAPVWSAVVVALSLVAWSIGMAQYVDAKRWRSKWTTWVAAAPQIGLVVLELAHVPVLRSIGNLLYFVSFLTMVPVVWNARRTEPGAGHGILAASLLVLPVATALFLLLRVDIFYLRHLAIPSLMIFNVTLLVVSIYRRQANLIQEIERRTQAERLARGANEALVEVNATLESRIEERTETLRDMVHALESFNRNVSHDLRGPLGGIQGTASLLRSNLAKGRETPEKVDRKLRLIEEQARRSSELVGAMLDLALVSNTTVSRSAVAMDALVEGVLEELTLHDGNDPAVAVGALPVIDADPTLVRIVLTNLVANAFKFVRGRSGAKVEIAADLLNGTWTFSVRDNGPGFAPEAAGELFEPFRRLHGTEFSGHGVGLSIVRRVAERHGGRVWAEGSPGRGACFWFTLAPQRSTMEARSLGSATS